MLKDRGKQMADGCDSHRSLCVRRHWLSKKNPWVRLPVLPKWELKARLRKGHPV